MQCMRCLRTSAPGFELGDEKAEVKVNPVPAEYEDSAGKRLKNAPEAIEISE